MANIIRDMMNEEVNLDTRVPVIAPPTEKMTAKAFEQQDCTTLYWLGGGGFMLNARGTIILVDPILELKSEDPMIDADGHLMLRPFPMYTKDVVRCDMILFTHDDGDHANPETVNQLAERDIPMLGSARVFETLVKQGMKPYNFTVAHAGEKYKVGPLSIEITPADHPWHCIDDGRRFCPEDCVGFVVRTEDGGVFFTGDTRLMQEHLYMEDIALLPLDVSKCTFHLGRSAAALLANKYADAYLVPYHYGMFDAPDCPAQEGGDPELVLRNVNNRERGLVVGPGHPVSIRDRKLI